MDMYSNNSGDDEFDTFLAEAAADVQRSDAEKLQHEQLEAKADELLDELAIDSPFRFDETNRMTAYMAYYTEYRLRLMNEAVASGAEDAYEVAKVRAGTEVDVIEITHKTYLEDMLQACEEYTTNPSVEQATRYKKRVMACMQAHGGMAHDDPWLQFASRYMPGESLDFESPEDIAYLVEAQDILATQAQQADQFECVLSAYEAKLLGDSAELSAVRMFSSWSEACLEVFMALQGTAADADFEEAVARITREHGYSVEDTKAFIVDIAAIDSTDT